MNVKCNNASQIYTNLLFKDEKRNLSICWKRFHFLLSLFRSKDSCRVMQAIP